MFLAEVEVDAATGKTTVLSERMVYDIGAVGSVQAVDGQAYGSLTHSTGWALKDQYIDNKQYSNIVKCGFMYADEIPDDMVVESVENPIPRQTAAYGSVGCCEVFQSAMQSAILNGIDDAVGVRIYDLPATPEKVKAGMEAKARGEELVPEKYFLGSDLFEELDDIAEHPVEARGPAVAG